MKKLLVTGVSGFLGSYVATLDQEEWEIIGVYHQQKVEHTGLITHQHDLSNTKETQILLDKIRPEGILHLAALSNPNYCEQHPDLSKRINVDATVQLATYAHRHSIPFLFVSTDLVFDGVSGAYDLNSIPRPISIYGKHKILAEREVLSVYPEACVARCPVMFGLPEWGSSFMKNWLNKLQEGNPVYAFTDEYRSKVTGEDAVKGLFLLLAKSCSGIWHLGGKASISRYDFATLMAEIFAYPSNLIIPSIRADVKMPAARPADVSLNSEKAYDLGYAPKPIRDALQALSKDFKK